LKLIEYSSVLSKRDKEVLHSIKICNFLKTNQVSRLHFSDKSALSTVCRALTKLHKFGLIQPIKRRIGGVRAGSTSIVWALTMAGAELLNLGEPTPLKSRKRVYEPTYIFLKHTLAISELYTRLYTAAATNLMKAEFEPDCWRTYTSNFGVNVVLKPDLFAVTASDGYEDYWFFEVDMDTEAPSRILRKCESYAKYFLTGGEQKRIGVFPRVAWIVPDNKRKESISRHIREHSNEYADLFVVATFEELDVLFSSGNNGQTVMNILDKKISCGGLGHE